MKINRIINKLPTGFVKIHREAFEGFFLTSLGCKFLRLYYRSVLRSENGIILCLFDKNEVLIGFAVGTKHSKGFHRSIVVENIISYTLILLEIITLKPKAIIRLVKNFSKGKNTNKDNGDYAELLSIAVSSDHKGQGYGKLLLKEFELVLKSCSIVSLTLTTDCYNNNSVISFYKKNGYEVFYRFIAYPQRIMYKLIKVL